MIRALYYRLRSKEVALEASIKHWERNATRVSNNEKLLLGPNNCPLCMKYNHFPKVCEGCPVYAETEQKHCEGTDYESILHTHASSVAVKGFLNFLKGLRE